MGNSDTTAAVPATFPLDIPVIGADAELQARLRADVNRRRRRGKSAVHPRLSELSNNQRKATRYEISNSVVCFPVLESHEVATDVPMAGIALDVGTGGIKVLVESATPYIGMEIVVGLERRNGQFHFSGGTVKSIRQGAGTGHEIGIDFNGVLNQLLSAEQIFPVLNRDLMRLELPYPENILASLCKIGAAVSMPLDSVLACPNCRGIPTVRTGCSICLSNNVRSSRMIHHFACANVDFVERFEHGDELVCGKCRTRGMLIGSDYEYLDGPNTCFDCGQTNLEAIQIGHCLGCENRFAFEFAVPLEIVGYRVHRLDLLGFLAANG